MTASSPAPSTSSGRGGVPVLLDAYTERLHLTALGCKGGLKCRLHPSSAAEIRSDLVSFMGELLNAFEVAHFGDPLPVEEREWAQFEQEQAEGPFGKVKP